jgi:hypothetical protein
MKNSAKYLALATLCMGVAAAQAQEVTIKRTYTEGATEKYTITSQMTSSTDMSSMGQGEMGMNIDSSMEATYTYTGVKEDGSALLKFVYSNIKTQMDGPMAEMMRGGGQTPTEVKGTAKIDALGRMTETKYEGVQAGMMAMMSGGSNAWDLIALFTYPSKPVKAGDTWDSELPSMGGMFPKGSKVVGTFVGEAAFRDKKAWKLEYTGKPTMQMDIGKMMRENPGAAEQGMPEMNIMMEGTNGLKITVLVNQENGQVLQVEVASDTNAKVKLVDMGMEFPVTGQAIAKMVLKP